jgi:hypothetical protein
MLAHLQSADQTIAEKKQTWVWYIENLLLLVPINCALAKEPCLNKRSYPSSTFLPMLPTGGLR